MLGISGEKLNTDIKGHIRKLKLGIAASPSLLAGEIHIDVDAYGKVFEAWVKETPHITVVIVVRVSYIG